MRRYFRLDPGSIFGDPHAGAEAAASVRFKRLPDEGRAETARTTGRTPDDPEASGTLAPGLRQEPKHRRQRRSWRDALVLLCQKAWRSQG